jgi:hypothetical protein
MDKTDKTLKSVTTIEKKTEKFETKQNSASLKDLIKLKPFGFHLTSPSGLPIFLLKDEAGEITLPVRVSPIEVGISLSPSQRLEGISPHRVSLALMASLNLKPSRAVFCEIEKNQQHLEIFFEIKDPHTAAQNSLTGLVSAPTIKVRAEEAISFCLFTEIPFFASREFIWNSRALALEAEKELQLLGHIASHRPHPYLM